MNAKQIIPVIAKIAPPALFGVAIYYGLKWLFSTDDTEKKPETAPASTGTERRRKDAETTAFRPIPAETPAKPAAVHVPSASRVIVPPPAVPSVPKVTAFAPVPAAVTVPKIVTQAPPPPPIKKKFVTREDLANIFQRGARALTRTAAVAALKKLGFGKTAAYAALTPNGRFSTWLQFAPDGIITWTE